MVNIGVLGDVNVGKTSILKMFIQYIHQYKNDCEILKTDFSGEAVISTDSEPKTIHPNRIIFRLKETGGTHTIFAPGGDKDRPVVKMGIITISRISNIMLFVFDLGLSIKRQFEFIDSIRHIPKKVYVALNKYDIYERAGSSLELENIKKIIITKFNRKKKKILDFFVTCGINIPEYSKYNDMAGEMLYRIARDYDLQKQKILDS